MNKFNSLATTFLLGFLLVIVNGSSFDGENCGFVFGFSGCVSFANSKCVSSCLHFILVSWIFFDTFGSHIILTFSFAVERKFFKYNSCNPNKGKVFGRPISLKQRRKSVKRDNY
jgi:hypothetical protein